MLAARRRPELESQKVIGAKGHFLAKLIGTAPTPTRRSWRRCAAEAEVRKKKRGLAEQNRVGVADMVLTILSPTKTLLPLQQTFLL